MRRRHFLAGAAATCLLPSAAKAAVVTNAYNITVTTTSPATGPSLTLVPGTHFAADSYVHAPLAANAPLDPNSAGYVANLLLQLRLLDPTRGYYLGIQALGNTPPIWIAPANAPTQQLWVDPADTNALPLNCEMRAVPFPTGFAVSPGSDSESMIYQPSSDQLWETWNTRPTGRMILNSAGQSVPEWGAQWGGHMGQHYPPLSQNRGYWPPISGTGSDPQCGNYDGYFFGTSASGLAMLAGMMTIEEQRAGVINHALHIAIGWTKGGPNNVIPPAQRSDGFSLDSYALPEGLCFRFPASLDLTTFGMTPYGLMVARAIQNHGLYIRDGTASTAVLYAQDFVNWTGDPYTNELWHGLEGSTNGILQGMPFERLQVVDWHSLPI